MQEEGDVIYLGLTPQVSIPTTAVSFASMAPGPFSTILALLFCKITLVFL